MQIPGIGSFNAERIAYFLTLSDPNFIQKFGNSILELKNLKKCKCCNLLSDTDICHICSDPTRDHTKLIIVNDSKDAYVIEQTRYFKGIYHVLTNKIDYSRGITEKNLTIEGLYSKIDNEVEVILALDGTLEGEITAKYIKSILPNGTKVKKIAFGIPVGTDLKFVDKQTIISAIENSKEY
jgi:recombination protein RecR